MINIEFSVLSYFPTFLTTESINLGIIFHDVTNDIRRFDSIKNWNRISNFDDEVDIDMLKAVLDGVKKEISKDTFFNFNSKFDLYTYTKPYVNELKFSKITSIMADKFDEFIDETKKVILRFDYNKKERISKDQQDKYIKKILESKQVEFSREKLTGYFSETVKYDFIIGNYAIKVFNFENKDIPHIVSNAKAWAYNAQKLKNQYHTIFIYDMERPDDPTFSKVLKILQEESYKTFNITEATNFLTNL